MLVVVMRRRILHHGTRQDVSHGRIGGDGRDVHAYFYVWLGLTCGSPVDRQIAQRNDIVNNSVQPCNLLVVLLE